VSFHLKNRRWFPVWQARFARGAALLAMAIAASCLMLMAQQMQQQQQQQQEQQQDQPPSQYGQFDQDYSMVPLSSLARQNLNYVAASAPEIETVLDQQPGLLVELQHWLARDATDHGQMVDENQMSKDGIYARLDSDLKFRAVATRLLRQYGYLTPEVNPNSSLAMQQQIEYMALEKRLEQAPTSQSPTGQYQGEGQNYPAGLQNPGTNMQSPRFRMNQQPSMQPQWGPMPNMRQGQPDLNSPGGLPLNLQEANQNLGPQAFPNSQGMGNSSPRQTALRQANNGGDNDGGPDSSDGLGSTGGLGSMGGLGGMSSMGGVGGQAGLGGMGLGSSYGQGLNSFSASANFPPLSTLQPGSNLDRSQLEQQLREQGPQSLGNMQSPQMQQWQNSPYYRQTGASYMVPWTRPLVFHRPNPYSDIPSLYDLYEQVSPHSPRLERFGLDIFQNLPVDTTELPMDLPAGPSYVVGPGDGLTINLWGSVASRMYRVVDSEGRLSLPEVGPLMVSGETMGTVQQRVQQAMRTQFRNVSADVSLAQLRTVRVYVVGEVVNPGAYDISSLSTPLNALLAAGGPTKDGSLRMVKQYRGKELVQDVDLYDLLLHGVRSDLKGLENGDTILVPPVGAEVKVEGMVRRPAIYELHGEKTLAQVLQLAGGILPTAALRHIEVQRVVAHEKRTMLSFNIHNPKGSAEINQQLQSFAVHDRDVIRIFPIAPYNEDAVYLEGHVLRPGRYSYHPGMRLGNLISSYSDMLPEPARHYAEIIRLNPPDYSPSVESFDLASALANPKTSPKLEPLDTVRIFSRFDFHQAPVVTVDGDVRNPGTYRTSGVVRLRDAIYQAGGVAPDAYLGTAQLVRNMPDGKLKIVSINLREALNGDPLENVLLESRDSILIQRNPLKADPPSVYVEGQVVRPGRFPLTANLHVSDLVGLAGGLKRSADRQSADLTTYNLKGNNPANGQHEEINLAAALKGTGPEDPPLQDGDVLTIKQVQGWDQVGASIMIRGEVVHPGTYGISPGEHLSSVLERAGGFTSQAYPYGAILERKEVRRMQMSSYQDLVDRIRQSQSELQTQVKAESDHDQKLSLEAGYQQWQTTLQNLLENPPIGRVVVHISKDIHHWSHSTSDVQLRAGDVLIIPMRPSYVMVQGQVYSPTAASYHPGKSAKWYLNQSGGATNLAEKNAIFVIRADGSVIGSKGFSLWRGNPLDATLYPGDTVVVPEKPVTGPPQWKTIFQSAQVVSSIVTSAVLVAHYY
jgi:polysaccharide biosynthesis/export protein